MAFLGQRGTKHEALNNPGSVRAKASARKLVTLQRATAGDGRKMSNEALEREPIDRMRARLEVLLEANAAPRCGARSKRSGKPCRGAAMPNGRCWQGADRSAEREGRSSPPAHRGARVIRTDALRFMLILEEPRGGQERKQDSEDDPEARRRIGWIAFHQDAVETSRYNLTSSGHVSR